MQLKPYMRPLMMTLLTRMQTSKTDKYVYHFTYFLLLMIAIDVAGMGPDYLISTVEDIQPQCVLSELTERADGRVVIDYGRRS